jgi:multidrug efflux pump subunit AcrA (membrane-fusion protein)
LIVLLLVAIVATAAYVLTRNRNAPATPIATFRTAKVTAAPIAHTLRVSGQTGARNYANIVTPMMRGGRQQFGQLTLLKLAKGGTRVHKGDLLAEIDPQTAQDALDDAVASLEQADMDLKKKEAEQALSWENLQQTVRVAKADLDKARLDSGAAEVRTDVDRELLKLSVEEAEARYKQAQADIDPTKAGYASDMRIQAITKERLQKQKERLEENLRKYKIYAPIDGLVVLESTSRGGGGDRAQIQEGDQVSPGMPIMKIVNPDSMEVQGTVNQSESSQLRVGLPAAISLDAFPGLTFKGKVYSIGAMAMGGQRVNYFIRNVPVKIAIEGSDSRLIPDLSAAADVQIATAPSGPVVPLGAVKYENGKPVAYVKKGEQFERREIQLGISSNTHAQVLAGLQTGDEVRLN